MTPKNQLVSKKDLVIFTACSLNYLEKAIAMCLSAEDCHPDADLVILVVDRKRSVSLVNSKLKLWWSEDVGFPEYVQCAFKYNIIEFNTAIKPYAALRLLEAYDKVIFLDPDTCLYSPLNSVLDALSHHSSIFTPVSLSPYDGADRPNDIDLLRFGSNCLGFFAVKNSENSKKLLEWWHQQCLNNCFYEPQIGLAVDQKWIDLAPSFFEGTYLLKDPGLNVAFWNLHERVISKTDKGWRVNADYPLGFIHFSSFSDTDITAVANKQTRYPSGSRPDFSNAADVYRNYLSKVKLVLVNNNNDYGYSKFSNGEPISPTLRRFYAVYKEDKFKSVSDPFCADGPVYFFAKKNKLLSRSKFPETHINFKTGDSYYIQRKILAILFKLILRLLGPDRYFLFLRYLSYYSSIFNQSNIFRD